METVFLFYRLFFYVYLSFCLVFIKNSGRPIVNPKNGIAQIIKSKGCHFISCNLLFAVRRLGETQQMN